MTSPGKIGKAVIDFVVDYIERHAHPVNALCHIVGVPLAFFGLYKLFTGQLAAAAACLFPGYLLQYIGHRAQGNEVGEVTLIKAIWRKLKQKGRLHDCSSISASDDRSSRKTTAADQSW